MPSSKHNKPISLAPIKSRTPPKADTPPEINKICLSCRFIKIMDEHSGLCRYNPPVIVQTRPGDKSSVRYPQVDFSGWCGRYEQNK